MSLGFAVLLILAGGAAGGVAEIFSRISFRDGLKFEDQPFSPSSLIFMVIVSLTIGMVGALAIQFIFVLLGSFTSESTLQRQMFLLSISAAVGFGARRVLPHLTGQVIAQIEQLKREDEKLEKKINKIEIEADESVVFSKTFTALDLKWIPPDNFAWCCENLGTIRARDPKNRTAYVLLGRLHKKQKNYKMAIDVLSEFIQTKTQAGELDDDFADVLYNRACYASLYSEAAQSPLKESLQQRAIQDLKRSIELAPRNREHARHDTDFDAIRALVKTLTDPA